jgi:hypothetical protein
MGLCGNHRVHRVAMATFWRNSLLRVQLPQPGEGPFILSTITYKVVAYAPAERVDTLPLFLLYPYINSVVVTRCSGLYKGAFGVPGGNGWEQELTVQGLYSVENLKYVKTSLLVYQIRGTIRVKRHEIIGRYTYIIHTCMNCTSGMYNAH